MNWQIQLLVSRGKFSTGKHANHFFLTRKKNKNKLRFSRFLAFEWREFSKLLETKILEKILAISKSFQKKT